MSKAEVRAIGDIAFVMEGDKPRIDARAIKYDSWSVDLGGFRERIVAGAMNLDQDLVALFDHSTDKVLGRVSAGTMEVREDSLGVAFTAYLPDTTWAKDLQVSMKRGDIKGCSFRMFVDQEKWYTDASGQICRDILSARVSELTVTSMPAYPETTAEARSAVEALKALPVEERAGRVLSMDNQGRLVLAKEVIDTAADLLEKTAELLDKAGETIDAVLVTVDPSYVPEMEEGEDVQEEDLTTEMSNGALEASRSHSVGATETPNNKPKLNSVFTKFGFITTRKE